MSVLALERPAVKRLRKLFPPTVLDRNTPLPLRTELFLVAHDDDTGRCHLDEDTLATGLAGAVLLELWLTERIQIGLRYEARTARWLLEPGRITVLHTEPVGDPLTDTALATILQSGGAVTSTQFVKRFAATGLYERVRADLTAAGLVRRVVRRRFGLFRRESYEIVHSEHSVRARYRVRLLAENFWLDPDTHRSDNRTLALTALIGAMELSRHLYAFGTRSGSLHERLMLITREQPSPPIRDVVSAILGRDITAPPPAPADP